MGIREEKFNQCAKKASECRICPRMADQPAVLGPANGSLKAQIVFIAEAPGRFGAGRTGIPFTGDRSGENFDALLTSAGLSREKIFITNAVLCNPLENGKNGSPTSTEIRNCSGFLESILDIIQPLLVVTLGRSGLRAVNRILGETNNNNQGMGKLFLTPGFTLLPLYHPSPRVTNWRRTLVQQKRDFKKIPELLNSLIHARGSR